MPEIDFLTVTRPGVDPSDVMQKLIDEGGEFTYFVGGDPVFFTKDGKKLHQAKFSNIDWDKMKEHAHTNATNNADESQKFGDDREEFIKIREKVHLRPSLFIDKEGVLHTEFDNGPQGHQEAWDTILIQVLPDDVFTHWRVGD